MFRRRLDVTVIALLLAGTVGCVTTQSTSSQSATKSESQPAPQAKSKEAEKPKQGPCTTKLSRVKVGMTEKEVHAQVGNPTTTEWRPNGKAFIPFYRGETSNKIEIYGGAGWVEYDTDHVVYYVECESSGGGKK